MSADFLDTFEPDDLKGAAPHHPAMTKEEVFQKLCRIEKTFSQFRIPEDVDTFSELWQSLDQFDFSHAELAEILEKIGHALKEITQGSSYEFGVECNHALANHWDVWEQQMCPVLPIANMPLEALTQSIKALGLLNLRPSPSFINRMTQRLTDEFPTLMMEEIGDSFRMFALLALPIPDDLLTLYAKEFRTPHQELTLPQKVGTLWGAAILDSKKTHPAFKEIAQDMARQRVHDCQKIHFRKQVYDACLWFGIPSAIQNPKREDGFTSVTEHHLKRIFKAANIPAFESHPVPEMPKAIDFAFRIGRRTVQVEYDGPDHFLSAPEHDAKDPHNPIYNGQTLFRAHVVARLLPNAVILHIPYTVNDILRDVTNQKERMRAIAEQAATQAPGLYKVEVSPDKTFKIVPMHETKQPAPTNGPILKHDIA